jgi:hypothetical protein
LPAKIYYLGDLNINLTIKILKYLGIKTKTYRSSKIKNLQDPQDLQDKNENLIRIIKKFNCTEYLTGPTGTNYLDFKKFIKNNIKINIYNLDNEFLHKFKKENNLSILHLMFCNELENIFQ